ncbi:MAG: NYN domain-containing protein [Candidatus Omnitrophica bacterium]|nr:NYN domain-containing protein [Candidatus Omnitrophota bacterium]
MKRTHIYVDGFNLYYCAIRNTPYRWLDLKALFQKLLAKDHTIDSIKYFTAIVSGVKDPQKPTRQQTYIRALEKFIPEISVYYGQFLSHIRKAPLAYPTKQKKFEYVIETEEKGSDVNLAVQLLNDGWLNKYDCAVIVSNDSDLAEALKIVKVQHKKLIGLILPTNCFPSQELIKFADFVKRIRKNVLAISQLPNPIPGTNIHKPNIW